MQVWSYLEFEVSKKTEVDPAMLQFILYVDKVAVLFSDKFTNKTSFWAKNKRKQLAEIVEKLNMKQYKNTGRGGNDEK